MSVDQSAVQDGLGAAIETAAGASPATELANLTRVMGATDRDATYPYVTIGECEVNAGGTDCADTATLIFPMHIWTKEKGFTQCKKIDAALIDLFDDTPFAVTGHTVTGCFHRRSRFMRDPQRGIRHGITELLIQVEKT